ncbi:hypothetical protein BT93_B2770 [Corymbia citriodora subsp. variegata]|nr:hypothetical protein BT93_B2770 [Corymbia citriodora subsp. variegata]
MDLRDMGFDPTVLDTLHELLDLSDEADGKSHHAPSRAFLRDKKAMAATPADVKEYPNSYVFVLDMPGLKPDQIRVQVEEGNMLVVSGERKREKEKDLKDQKDGDGGGLLRYIKMERRLGKYLKKFVLPENADPEKITAAYQDGVLTVTVEKRPPPEPKKPKSIEVQIA